MRALPLALLVFLVPAGAGAGRAGLDLLRAGDAAGAEERFRAGLSAPPADEIDDPAGAALRTALWNGVGLSLLAQDDAAGATAAFDSASTWAAHDTVVAMMAYNAGTAAAGAERWEAARDRLVRALLLHPADANARHNLEIVLRHLSGAPPAGGGAPPEPSEFARRLKAEADRLVAERRYMGALALLRDGLSRDSTVAAFADAIRRLEAVVGIVQADSLGTAEQ